MWAEDGDTEALVQGEVRLSRAEARDKLFRLGHALLGEGLAPGDSVGLFLANRPEAVLVQLAVHLIGCRVVFLPPEPGQGELVALAERAQVRAVVFDPRFADDAIGLAELAAGAPRLLGLGATGRATDLLEAASACPAEPPPAPPHAEQDAMTVFYTGGTLGHPKLAAHGRGFYDWVLGWRLPLPGGRALVATLLTHGTGHLTSLFALINGITTVLLPEFEPGAALAALREEEITTTVLVPPMLYQMLDHPDCRAGDYPSLQMMSLGGAPASPTRMREAADVFGPVIGQGYGQSEALCITSVQGPELADGDLSRWSSCGRPVEGITVQIRDEDGTALPTGEAGEVCVRGEVVMLGYLGDPERTRETLRDGWLHTGDIGYRDEDGYLYLVDRAKDIIVTGDTSDNVYSRVLEDFLLTLKGVRNSAAIAVPDDRYGEAVKVFLATDGDIEIDTAEVRAAVVAELGALYQPREIVLVPALPLTHVGKVDKKALRALG
ncbi:fatty-acid--CoA ligase FadD8 [Amycolatopsis minnesotensis]|uniref:Fatty-acid--CoA ligase FadD8 n=1 Tax=Amycolatopsis minnesotensis TaxID=337894 RepID=A0ABN2QPZ7_9PSEU